MSEEKHEGISVVTMEIEKYDKLLEKVGASMYEGWDEFKPKVMSLESRLNAIGIEMTP